MTLSTPANRSGGRSEASGLNFVGGGGELGALIRAHGWADSPLGPPDSWPQSLKTAVRIMLTSRQPIWIGWGTELIYLYNDAYQTIIGGKHPWALGRPTREVWSEIWSDIGPMLATAMGGVEGTYVEEQLLIMERNGYPEETYYTFSYSPIPDDEGNPGGIICANTDDTARVIGERQLKLLRALATETGDARSWTEACERSIGVLGTDPQDVAFSLLYMLAPDSDELALAGSHNMPAGHPVAFKILRFDDEKVWPIAAVLGITKLELSISPVCPAKPCTPPPGVVRRARPHCWQSRPLEKADELGAYRRPQSISPVR